MKETLRCKTINIKVVYKPLKSIHYGTRAQITNTVTRGMGRACFFTFFVTLFHISRPLYLVGDSNPLRDLGAESKFHSFSVLE